MAHLSALVLQSKHVEGQFPFPRLRQPWSTREVTAPLMLGWNEAVDVPIVRRPLPICHCARSGRQYPLMQAASSSRPVPDALSASGLALRRLSGITASVRPCSCCLQLQQQQQQPRPQQLPVLQQQQQHHNSALNGATVTRHIQISRRRLVIRASGAAGGLGGHRGGRGEPVSHSQLLSTIPSRDIATARPCGQGISQSSSERVHAIYPSQTC